MATKKAAETPEQLEMLPKEKTAVATQSSVPSYLTDYKGPVGDETIDSGDVTIPRLKIGQAIMDEVKSGALREGDVYINVTGQVVWSPAEDEKAPLPFSIVAHSKEYILWAPRQDGGGILARARPVRGEDKATRFKWDRPNQEFKVKVGSGTSKIETVWKTKEFIDEKEIGGDGKPLPGLGDWGSEISGNLESGIAATAHHNYVVLLPTLSNLVAAISLSRSSNKVAKNLNAMIKMGDARYPLPTRKFSLVTFTDQNQTGDKFKNWSFKMGGYMTEADRELASVAMQQFAYFRDLSYVVDQSDAGAADEARGQSGGGAF